MKIQVIIIFTTWFLISSSSCCNRGGDLNYFFKFRLKDRASGQDLVYGSNSKFNRDTIRVYDNNLVQIYDTIDYLLLYSPVNRYKILIYLDSTDVDTIEFNYENAKNCNHTISVKYNSEIVCSNCKNVVYDIKK